MTKKYFIPLIIPILQGGAGGAMGAIMEEEDPSVFVPSAEAFESLSEEEAAAAVEGLVR